ncbi:hypothetical protein L7F22_002099 [Adiantum nelumboides]|nr:hypothetical protein [Adiantum nelumboides]
MPPSTCKRLSVLRATIMKHSIATANIPTPQPFRLRTLRHSRLLSHVVGALQMIARRCGLLRMQQQAAIPLDGSATGACSAEGTDKEQCRLSHERQRLDDNAGLMRTHPLSLALSKPTGGGEREGRRKALLQ